MRATPATSGITSCRPHYLAANHAWTRSLHAAVLHTKHASSTAAHNNSCLETPHSQHDTHDYMAAPHTAPPTLPPRAEPQLCYTLLAAALLCHCRCCSSGQQRCDPCCPGCWGCLGWLQHAHLPLGSAPQVAEVFAAPAIAIMVVHEVGGHQVGGGTKLRGTVVH